MSQMNFFFGGAVLCGLQDLSSRPGIEPVYSAVKAKSSNHWIFREFPQMIFLDYTMCFFCYSEIKKQNCFKSKISTVLLYLQLFFNLETSQYISAVESIWSFRDRTTQEWQSGISPHVITKSKSQRVKRNSAKYKCWALIIYQSSVNFLQMI